jgi:hypothetical protein
MLEVVPVGRPACHSPRVCLTVLVPDTLEERVVDWLLSHPDWQVEFSVHRVAARGPLVRLALNDERVQGFAQRVELKLIIERGQLAALLAEVQTLLAGLEGGYWVLPVETFGEFAKTTVMVDVLV